MGQRQNSGEFARDQLVVIDPSGRKLLYEMRGNRLSVGRSAENTISLKSRNISRTHLHLRKVGTEWEIIDAGGANGTSVGSQYLRPHRARLLRPLEQATAGEFTLYWQRVGQPQAQRSGATDNSYSGSGFNGWYVASAFVTMAILAIGVWSILGILPSIGINLSMIPPESAEYEWSGEWNTTCEWLPCGRVELQQTSEGVTGRYLNGTGTLHGVVEGDRLVGVWLLGGASGTFEFTLSEQATTFTGVWDENWGWCGAQSGLQIPVDCPSSNS